MVQNSNRVAVVIPHWSCKLSSSLDYSLQLCYSVLGKHPIFYLTKKSEDVHLLDQYRDRIEFLQVDDTCLDSNDSYNKFLMSPEFYRLFERFEYILIYQLDVVVFEDRLLEWCDKGYDYVGPPMFQGDEPHSVLWQAGNGGFSLRKVSSFLELLTSRKVFKKFEQFRQLRAELGLLYLVTLRIMLQFSNSWLTGYFPGLFRVLYIKTSRCIHEDGYFAFFAEFFIEKWAMPTAEESASFAYDRCPRTAHAINGFKTPFGCHAWEKFDKAFVEGLLKDSQKTITAVSVSKP